MFSKVWSAALTKRIQYCVLAANITAAFIGWLGYSCIHLLYNQEKLSERFLLVDVLEVAFASWIPVINKTFYGFNELGEQSIAMMFLLTLSFSWSLVAILVIVSLFILFQNSRRSILKLPESEKLKIVTFKEWRLSQDSAPRILRIIGCAAAVFVSTMILLSVFGGPSNVSSIGVNDLMYYCMSPFICLIMLSFVAVWLRIEWIEKMVGNQMPSFQQEHH